MPVQLKQLIVEQAVAQILPIGRGLFPALCLQFFHLPPLRLGLFQRRLQHATNQLDNPLKIQTVKRDIARVKTIIRERELRTEA